MDHKEIQQVVGDVVGSYKNKRAYRGMLTNIAAEIGMLPLVRRVTATFTNRKKFPERPTITLWDKGPSIYLLGWREGDFTDIHDHGGCEVGIYVMQGVVTEDLYACSPVNRAGHRKCLLEFSRQARQGDTLTCPKDYIHTMGNLFPEAAATLHVYGPALSDMCLYERSHLGMKYKEHWHDAHKPQH